MSDPEPTFESRPIPYATPAPRRPFRMALMLTLAAGLLLVLLTAWGLSRSVKVTVNVSPATRRPAPVRPRPARVRPVLDLPSEPPRLMIDQRSSDAIPGSANTVFVELRDISGGRVRLRVRTVDHGMLAVMTARPGDALEFALDGKRYVVVVARFDLSLTGTDRGEIVVRRAEDPPTGEERIGRLLDAAWTSSAVVVPPPAAVDGAADASPVAGRQSKPLDDYLRDVWLFRKPRSTTPEALAAQAVRPADAAAVPPRVRLRHGAEMPLEEWLKPELAKLK